MIHSYSDEIISDVHDWRLFSRLLGFTRPYRSSFLTVLVLTVINAPLTAAGPIFTKAAIDLFIAPDLSKAPTGFLHWLKAMAEAAGFGGSRYRGIIFIAIIYLLVNITSLAIQYLHLSLIATMGQRVMRDIRQAIFTHLLKVPIQFYDRNPVGGLMARTTADVESLNEMFSSGVVAILGDVAVAVFVLAWMFKMNWKLAAVSFIAVILLGLFSIWFMNHAKSAYRAIRLHMARISAFLQEHISGMQTVQLFGCEAREMNAFRLVNHEYWQAALKTNFCNAIFYPAIEVIVAIGTALIIWYGGSQVIHQAISLGTLVAFIQLARSFYDPISEVTDKYNVVQAALASADRIFQLLDEPFIPELPQQQQLTPGGFQGRVEFRNIWFAYHNDEWVLRDISFVAEPGEKIAFVGHTGAGKTTIINLLLRFYEIQRGQIFLDGIDIRHIAPGDLRTAFGTVPQDIFLFTGDIISNIRLGDSRITEEEVKSSACKLRVDNFVASMEKGYGSVLMENGAGLSVGQKQLIGFSRAMAFNRPILVLDEATSSIDTETEVLVQEAVKRVMDGRTSLVIAHRLSTIQSVDKIIVMQKGEIREMGSHQSLIEQRGIYWKLYQLQFDRESQITKQMQ
jgi:ATP-binding cassette subfamily B multidrug efflux pump